MNLVDLPEHVQKAIKGVRVVTAKCLGLKHDAQGHRLCRWCHNKVDQGRRYWCSRVCVDYFNTLKNVSRTIYARDKGECRICKTPIVQRQAILTEAYQIYNQWQTLNYKITHREAMLAKNPDWGTSEFWSSGRASKDVNAMQACIVTLNAMQQQYPEWFKRNTQGVWKPKYREASHIDHIKPVADGGTTTACNLRLVCTFCHEKITAEYRERAKTITAS